MKRKDIKAIKSCFGTFEYSEKSTICKKCQHHIKCGKELRTEYPSVERSYHPRYNPDKSKKTATKKEELKYGRDY